MAEFNTFDLGSVLQTAESIKSARRQSITDELQQRYLNTKVQREDDAYRQQQEAQELRKGYAEIANILNAQDPIQAARSNPMLLAKFQQQGVDVSQVPDDALLQSLQKRQRDLASELGEVLPQRPAQMETIEGPDGAILQRNPTTGALTMVLNRERREAQPAQPQETFRTMTPDEVKAAGLPDGTSAQLSSRGKVDVLSKRDNTSALSQKDATVAKIKLNQLRVAKQQLQNVRAKFAEIKGSMVAGPGQGLLPTPKGQSFDKAVDAMRGSITAITRVPGVGAMSDYETRLDQSKFPSRNAYENVTEEQIAQLEQMIATIESGYSDLLNGGSGTVTPSGGASASWGAPVSVGGFTVRRVK